MPRSRTSPTPAIRLRIGKVERRQHAVGRVALRDEHPGDQEAQAPADDGDGERFHQDEREDASFAEPERLQDRQLVRALADRLRHGVTRHEEDEGHDDGGDRAS